MTEEAKHESPWTIVETEPERTPHPTPVVYELDENGEATRAVFFCGDACAGSFRIDTFRHLRVSVPNATSAEYVAGETCHTCGKEIGT